jgi:hypothetical protein
MFTGEAIERFRRRGSLPRDDEEPVGGSQHCAQAQVVLRRDDDASVSGEAPV